MLVGLSATLYALVKTTAWWDDPSDLGTGIAALACGALAALSLRTARRARRRAEAIERRAREPDTPTREPDDSQNPIGHPGNDQQPQTRNNEGHNARNAER